MKNGRKDKDNFLITQEFFEISKKLDKKNSVSFEHYNSDN